MAERQELARSIVAEEARLLDEQDWGGWLSLYVDSAELWIPTWRNEQRLTSHPHQELSFMFLEGKALLTERVERVRSGRSAASMPIPRTAHLVTASNVRLLDDVDCAWVNSAWSSHVYDHKDAALTIYAGRYEHELIWTNGTYRIRRKKIVIINDRLVSRIDFFHV